MNTDLTRIFKRTAVILFLIFAFAGKICAFEIFQFSVAPKYALQNGQLNEYVICPNGHVESELNWPLEQISLLGFNASLGWEMFLLETDCLWGIPKASGTMLDSDWLNSSDLSMKTNYSESSNSLDSLCNLKLKLGVNIKTWDFLHIIPYAGVSYSRMAFTANGGTYWYGRPSDTGLSDYVPYNSSDAKTGSFDSLGDVITYEREMFNYNIGVKARYNFLTRFTVSIDFSASAFSQINSIDHHIITSYYYLDQMQGWFKCFDFAAEADVKIWRGLSAGLSFDMTIINQIQGIDYVKTGTSTTYNRGTNDMFSGYTVAGADGYWYNIEAFVRYSF